MKYIVVYLLLVLVTVALAATSLLSLVTATSPDFWEAVSVVWGIAICGTIFNSFVDRVVAWIVEQRP